MKNLILIFLIAISSLCLHAKTYQGKLRCWDNNNPKDLIPTYIDKYFNSNSYVDNNDRRSFIMDFSNPLTRWKFERVGFKVNYGWSISECEDWSEFIFRRVDLEKVLNGQKKSTNVKYRYQHQDEYIIFRVLKCEKAEEYPTKETPVFNLF